MNRFAPQRIGYMLRHMMVVQRRTAFISLAAIFGAFTIVISLSFLEGIVPELHGILAALYLFIAGVVVTSASFNELHDGKRSYAYLMMPASAVEKVTAVVIATAVLWIPVSILSYFLFSIAIAGISFLILGEAMPLFNPFTAGFLEVVGSYVVAHALFLFGAVYFRGKNLLKTVAALAGLGFGISLLTGLIGWLLFRNAAGEFEGLFTGAINQALAAERIDRAVDVLIVAHDIAQVLVQYVLPPALWVLTWQRFRETEVAHGV